LAIISEYDVTNLVIRVIASVIPALIAKFAPKVLKAALNFELVEDVFAIASSSSVISPFPFLTFSATSTTDLSTSENFFVSSSIFTFSEPIRLNSSTNFFVSSDISLRESFQLTILSNIVVLLPSES